MKRTGGFRQINLCVALGLALLAGCDRQQDAGVSNGDYQRQLQAEDQARSKDPAWKPALSEVAVIKVGAGRSAQFNNFCIDPAGNILVCLGTDGSKDNLVEVLSPEGKVLKTWPLETVPQAICMEPGGTVLVAGGGRIQRLDAEGKVLASAATPAANVPLPPDSDLMEMAKTYGTEGRPEERLKMVKTSLTSRRTQVTGLAVSGEDVFLSCPSTKNWSYCVYRLDRQFASPALIVEDLSGCCSQMDVQARDGKLWIAHNGRHRVECRDREGKSASSFGREDRKAADGFGGCCEPKNLRITDEYVYCAESGPPVAVKRFTPDGKFQGVMAIPTFDTGCVRTTVDFSPDGKRLYVMNPGGRAIHVFATGE